MDRIDYNMDQAVTKVKEGLQQVVKAEEHKKSNRPGFIIFVLILVICALAYLLYLKYKPSE